MVCEGPGEEDIEKISLHLVYVSSHWQMAVL